MPIAFVALGANLGQPVVQLQVAVRALDALPQTQVKRISSFYRSAAIGPAGQPDYCNAVAQLDTALEALPLLDALQTIEDAAGRVRGERWVARVLDLDLLLHGDTVCNSARLTLPHPELAHRDFVLVPLAEIAPDLAIPGLGKVQALLSRLPNTQLERWA